MKTWHWALVLFPLLSACSRGPEEKKTPVETIVPVTTVNVEEEMVQNTLDLTGVLKAQRKALLGAEMPGRVVRFHVDRGDRVQEGDLLVELSGEALVQAQAQLLSIEKDWGRMRRLLNQGAVTQQAFDQIDAGYKAAKAAYETVLASTQIQAPFSGTVTARFLEEGEIYSLMPGPAGAPAILALEKVDTLIASVQVAEKDIYSLKLGQVAKIRGSMAVDHPINGEVRRIDPSIDPVSGKAEVEIAVPNRKGRLLPGAVVDVSILIDEAKGLILPRRVLIRLAGTGSYYVFVASDGKAVRKNVKILKYSNDKTLISGLNSDDQVIDLGRFLVNDNDYIKIESIDHGEQR